MAFNLDDKNGIDRALGKTSAVKKNDAIPTYKGNDTELIKKYMISMKPSVGKKEAIAVMRNHGYGDRQFSAFIEDLIHSAYLSEFGNKD